MSQPEDLSAEDRHRWWKDAGGWQLRQLLLWRWDPIGVASAFPEAVDEYDRYAGQIQNVLSDGGGIIEVREVLRDAEAGMGLGDLEAGDDHRLRVALLIADWYPRSVSHWLNHR